MKKLSRPQRLTIGTSEPNVRIEAIQGGKCPEINIVIDHSGGVRTIAMVASIDRLKKLKSILIDV